MSNNTSQNASKAVFFFDIDNCLYPRSNKVHDMMVEMIDAYFAEHLSLAPEDAIKLHREYFANYGLAIEGLVRHHRIDPLEFNARVDDALRLDDVIMPNPALRKMLARVDKSKVTLWLLTNAYVNHARRVVELLGVGDLFDGITFCDYSKQPLVCKPSKEMYLKAMQDAGVGDVSRCFFVDDSYNNCLASQKLGWTTVHLVEEELPLPATPASKYCIRNILEIRQIFPEIFGV